MMARPGSQAPSYAGSAKAVQFSRTVTVNDTSYATITVTLPRSSRPISLIATISTGTALIQVQGNGVEYYGGAISPNVPLTLSLAGFPETTSVNVQTEQLATSGSTLAGSLFYN